MRIVPEIWPVFWRLLPCLNFPFFSVTLHPRDTGTYRATWLGRLSQILAAFLAVGICVSTGLAATKTQTNRRERARTLYSDAVKGSSKFYKIPVEKRTKKKFLEVLLGFDLVRRADPTFGNVPPSLTAMAKLYREMGDTFGDQQYYFLAIKSFQFIIQEYPYSRSARRAWYSIGEIQSADLHDLDAARNAYESFLKRNKHAQEVAEVRQKLKELKLLASRELKIDRAPTREKDSKNNNPLARVTEVRHWVGSNYTRVVVATGREVNYRVGRLQKPDRIYFDIFRSYPAETIKGKDLKVENGFLKKIRVGQYMPNVTRVVLDVDEVDDYRIFPLPNPYRLVVDIRGKVSRSPKLEAKIEPSSLRDRSGEALKPDSDGPKVSILGTPAADVSRGKVQTGSSKDLVGNENDRKRENARKIREQVTEVLSKPALPTSGGSRTLTRTLGLKIGRIVIDPGHGGHDPGTRGPTGLTEKKLVLDVALRLKKLIEGKLGSEVVLTRDEDKFIPLEERTAIANKQAADLFISLHANASRQRWVRGVETFYLSFTGSKTSLEVAARENASSRESVNRLQDMIRKIALNEKAEESEEFARIIQSSMYNRLRKVSWQKNRGVKKAPFVVLIGADMPAVLAEISFITNPKDETLLKKHSHRQRIAEALYGGIARYVESLGGVTLASHGTDQVSVSSEKAKF